MRVSEVFESIQGEGPWIGRPVLFVRLYGCNLNCPFCDTPYAKDGNCESQSDATIVKRIISSGVFNVVFTGGEPALQYNDIRKVINTVRGINLSVKFGIETNGTLLFDESIFDVVVVSPKRADIAKGWSDRPNVCIKFLAGNERDLAVIRKQMDAYMFANIPYVMPIGDTKEKIMQVSKKLVPVMLKTGMNVIWSPRLHILMEVK